MTITSKELRATSVRRSIIRRRRTDIVGRLNIYLKKAEGYQREATYHTKKGDLDRAESHSHYDDSALDDGS